MLSLGVCPKQRAKYAAARAYRVSAQLSCEIKGFAPGILENLGIAVYPGFGR